MTLAKTWWKSILAKQRYSRDQPGYQGAAGDTDSGVFINTNRMRSAVGPSGQSAQQMVVTAEDLKSAGVEAPFWWAARALGKTIRAIRLRRPMPRRLPTQGRDDRFAAE